MSKQVLAVAALVAFFCAAVVATHAGSEGRGGKLTGVEVRNSSFNATPPLPKPPSSSSAIAEFPSADWPTATPQEVGMDPDMFAAAMATVPSPSVVIRNGRIVGQKGDIARTGYIWSGSKSLMALIFARLLQQGRIANYDVVVPSSNVPSNPPATFRQFLSMTSDYNLSPHSPGNHYAYNNGGVHFYGQYLKNTYYPGKTEAQMLQDAYVSALGFQDALSYNTAGYLSGWDGGWSMSTRDLARISYLVLRNGNWNGEQILPASFINDLHQNQVPGGATEATGTDVFYNEYPATQRLPGAYSFGFWLPRHTTFGGSRSETEAVSMSGAFGTSVHISRSTDLVVVAVNTTPTDHGGAKVSGAVLDMFAASIIDGAPTPNPTPTPTPTPPSTPTSSLGRIAISSDGNDHDCDDLNATAMSVALLAKTGNASRLVYYGHSDHVWSTGLDGACNGGNREEEMRISSAETARMWGGFNLGAFINAKAQTTTAVAALAAQINASSGADPLWIIGAGPMEVIGRALAASDPNKRQFVTVVSHSEWNNGHAEEAGHGTWNFSELGSVLGANLRSIIDQNEGLQVHESNYSWLHQSSDPRLNWLWQRHLKSGLTPTFDPSDAGMIYWLITGADNGGDQNATPSKLRTILEGNTTPTPTPTPAPTPTPTPTSTPTPTPTPTPSGTVGIQGYVYADGVRIPGALVNVAGREISTRFDDAYFWFDSGIPIGSTIVATKAGYTFAQVTVQAGVEQLYFVQGHATGTPAPTPTPTATPTPTPTPTPTTTGPAVRKAKKKGHTLSNHLATSSGINQPLTSGDPVSTEALELFIADIQQAQVDFSAEQEIFSAAVRIEHELSAALQFALQANSYSMLGDMTSVKSHLREAITHLELTDVLVSHGNVVNPIDFASYMVRQHYVDFLDREPDEAGNDFWVNQIAACGTNAQCLEAKRIHVSAAFFLSIEFQQTGFFVHRLYKSSFGRVPLRLEFMPDTMAVSKGVIVGEADWEAKLADGKQAFLDGWVQRPDFMARYSNLTNRQYVDALIANLGVAISTADRIALISNLANGSSRATVLGILAENPTFSKAEFNRAFVLMQYFGYLGRDPDGSGFNFWLNKLNQFNGDYGRAEMVKAFLTSIEYRSRFRL